MTPYDDFDDDEDEELDDSGRPLDWNDDEEVEEELDFTESNRSRRWSKLIEPDE